MKKYMPASLNLKNVYVKIENLKGRELVLILVVVFGVFAVVGIPGSYFIKSRLTQHEISQNTIEESSKVASFEGKILYIDPSYYPQDKITHVLVDSKGKEIVLLKAKDQKLAIAENLYVKVTGKLSQTKSGNEKVLLVEEVLIQNATN